MGAHLWFYRMFRRNKFYTELCLQHLLLQYLSQQELVLHELQGCPTVHLNFDTPLISGMG